MHRHKNIYIKKLLNIEHYDNGKIASSDIFSKIMLVVVKYITMDGA